MLDKALIEVLVGKDEEVKDFEANPSIFLKKKFKIYKLKPQKLNLNLNKEKKKPSLALVIETDVSI